MTDSTIHASDIQQAQARISSEIAPTPLQYCARLSAETGCEVYLKREDLQDVRSYKIRGALNGMSNLPQEQRHRGIVTASAGNHAQGVAYACRTMGIAGKIFVPEPTPMQKRDRILVHGGDQVELVVVGSNFDEAAAAAHADAAERDAAFIEPFDARDTITGQGTVAAEVVAQLSAKGKSPDAVVVPVGGGGLISGITSYLADMAPDTRVVGMEPEGAASLRAAFDHGGPVTLDAVDPFVDGAAVKRLGALPYEILDANRERLSFDTVSEGAVCTDLLNLYQNEGIIAEPAGALSVAGLHQLDLKPGSTVVCVISGGNNDVLRYAEIMERSLVHRGLKHYFLVNFPQEPGQLRHFLHEILGPTDDITLFEYLKRNNRETGAALVGLQLSRAEDLDGLLQRMGESKISVQYLKPGTPEYEFLVA
ncbi:threonine ammonia-lyase IlvA [Corynebacterium kefirresidentii]|uniref:threonine ammonia-lyase IlvA n=1 Tax=Corynebacterium kefirresidentii TaxID=1979527 RepID=UPI0026538F0D|nr:threonine ammonia-lyase IlvA [Corynebacterium kefirresidentii]MDN8640969.1 threonine ammonia-lyase IlvA [Corynebacterium kefirresidentii]